MNSRGKSTRHDANVTESRELDYRWVRDRKLEKFRRAYFQEDWR